MNHVNQASHPNEIQLRNQKFSGIQETGFFQKIRFLGWLIFALTSQTKRKERP